MLYHRYPCPMDLVNSYISRGRFGEFVTEFLNAEFGRRKEDTDKENDLKLWIMYCHSFSDDTYLEWKKKVLSAGSDGQQQGTDANMTEEDIKAICNDLFDIQDE